MQRSPLIVLLGEIIGSHFMEATAVGYQFLSALRNSWLPHRFIGRVDTQARIDNQLRKSYQFLCELRCEAWETPEPVPFARRETGAHKILALGDTWGETAFDCAWMHITGQAPPGVDPADPALRFVVDVAGEGLIVDRDGGAVQGITSFASFCDPRRGAAGKHVVLTEGLMDAGGKIDFWIDAAANDLFGNHFSKFGKPKAKLRLLHLARCDAERRALHYDASVLADVYDQSRRDRALYAAIRQALKTQDRSILKLYLDARNDDPNTFEYSAMGHAHMDLAWLWPVRETWRKGARTFANQIMNLRLYPEAVFGATQAQLYQWMKDMYPDVYTGVKELHRQGRWELQGATWVEPDMNLIGGESMIRQFYYAKKFFREEFGEEPRIFWAPDTFGYCACLPQVMRLAGAPWFLTIKLSQNTDNKFPYHTFHWLGLDGSPVLAHMPPEDSYNATARPDSLVRGERVYRERGISGRAASLFGIGDGGGGPGFEHYERARRLADLKGMPKYTQERIHGFFAKLEAEDNGKYPSHRGELYLERHQGCYTTQARSKKYNRKCEFLLRNYELLAAQAQGDLPISMPEFDEIWKEILLYQFHDILPGSSINRVYEESHARYAILQARLEEGCSALLRQIYGGGQAVNLNSFDYDGPLFHDGWRRVHIPAFGGICLADASEIEHFHAKAEGSVIENDCARVEFRNGVITSFLHKATGREIAGGALNVFALYPDRGNCWDFKPHSYYKRCRRDARCTAFRVFTDGPRACAQAEYRVGGDTIRQEISLTDGSPLLRFSTGITHAGRRVMLRVRFPLAAIKNAAEASFNLPFGHIKRATTENNSIEKAQFEVSGQKFVDVSDADFGVSLLNDCKYGFRCKNGVLDMNLLRSPKHGPGTDVDLGEHTLEYALYPHAGNLSAETYAQAYFLNNPILLTGEGTAIDRPAFLRSTDENIVAEGMKLPDDGNGLLLRAYNCSEEPQRGQIVIDGYRPLEYADVMENGVGPAGETLELRGFELKIIRYVRRADGTPAAPGSP